MTQSAPNGRWSEARDAQLRRLRCDGASWAAIGAALGVSPGMARERGRRIGAPRQRNIPVVQHDDPGRPPLPPGHPRAWGLLVEGTLLAGLAWPGWA